MKCKSWEWIEYDGLKLWGIGIYEDGSLENPHGYSEESVRAAIRNVKTLRSKRGPFNKLLDRASK
jgi:hypothetical protein